MFRKCIFFNCNVQIVDQIQCDLFEFIMCEVKDLCIGIVMIQSVEFMLDYVYVKVYFMVFIGDLDKMQEVLNYVLGYLYNLLFKCLYIYMVLMLYFYYDQMIEKVVEMLCLIKEVNLMCVKDDDEVDVFVKDD